MGKLGTVQLQKIANPRARGRNGWFKPDRIEVHSCIPETNDGAEFDVNIMSTRSTYPAPILIKLLRSELEDLRTSLDAILNATTDTETKVVHDAYREACEEHYASEGNLELDTDAKVSIGEADGAYVQMWKWVTAVEAGLLGTDDEDGDDGICDCGRETSDCASDAGADYCADRDEYEKADCPDTFADFCRATGRPVDEEDEEDEEESDVISAITA